MMMKKKVDAMKNPGLAKLPKKVRNNMGFMRNGGMVDYEYEDGGMVDYEYADGGEIDLESIADDIRATMSAQAIQDAIDRQLESESESTPTKDEADAIKKRMRKGRGQTYMGGGMVKYGHGGDVSSGKGCGIATSGRKFSGTY
jgi:hypothetical protein|tara:strand:- start:174 stop:602 length:429 start_codon:yes stop_codon:yes gene_type:complete